MSGMTMRRGMHRLQFTIANGATLSDAMCIEGHVIASIIWPAAWTTATLMFQGSADGVTYAPVYDDAGTRVTIASASLSTAEARVYVNKAILEQLAGLSWLKLEAGAAQGAARSIGMILKA